MTRGEQTFDRIVDRALRVASRDGLDGLTIGKLASELGLSKSGLFAHFGSKDELQLKVLQGAVARFSETVVKPALSHKRGEKRLRALVSNWLAWGNDPGMPGGCIFVAAAAELDDRPGPLRDYLVGSQREWMELLARCARAALESGEFRKEVEPGQLAYELYSLMLGYNHARRLLREEKAEARVRTAIDRLFADARPR